MWEKFLDANEALGEMRNPRDQAVLEGAAPLLSEFQSIFDPNHGRQYLIDLAAGDLASDLRPGISLTRPHK